MNEAIETYVKSLTENSTPQKPLWNIEKIKLGKAPSWNYIDGCMLRALMKLGKLRGDGGCLRFCKDFLDYYVSPGGRLRGYDVREYNLDNICEGNALIDMYGLFPEERYLRAIDALQTQLARQPRTRDGNYYHKLIYPEQVWLDGLYMAQVFRVRCERRLGLYPCADDVISQFKNVRARMFDEKTRLYRHGYDASKSAFWADEGGLSRCAWLRAEGWLAAALCDCAVEWPGSEGDRTWLFGRLDEALTGLFQYIDRESRMLMQVVDRGRDAGNYPETSGSALVAYACIRAANAGGIPAAWRERGMRLLSDIERNMLVWNDGKLELRGICLVAGLGPDENRRRDGSYEYYISEPVVANEAKGVAPFLMAYAEAESAMNCGAEGEVNG